MDLRQPCILIELNGADPLHTASLHGTIRTVVLDWDEIDEYGVDDLIRIHDQVEEASPNTALHLRQQLRKRGATVPSEYNGDPSWALAH